jgi:chorismate-pyruvate lyase
MESEYDGHDAVARATALVGLFCSPTEFGEIRNVGAEQVPQPSRTLLDHRSHMTVAMERFYGCDVCLRVVATKADGGDDSPSNGWYAREILLETPAGVVVQHGIVRINLASLDEATAVEIRRAQRPLGRILIAAGMLRDVHGVQLLEVLPGPHLRQLFLSDESAAAAPVYGRVANIQLNGLPAVELLEIVAPGP